MRVRERRYDSVCRNHFAMQRSRPFCETTLPQSAAWPSYSSICLTMSLIPILTRQPCDKCQDKYHLTALCEITKHKGIRTRSRIFTRAYTVVWTDDTPVCDLAVTAKDTTESDFDAQNFHHDTKRELGYYRTDGLQDDVLFLIGFVLLLKLSTTCQGHFS